MTASETEDSDILWCINHDSFPFKKPLMETQVGFPETGPISSTLLLMLDPLFLRSVSDDVKCRRAFLGHLCC